MSARRKKVAVALLLLGLAVLACAQVWCRPVDRDEGFWLYTSWRVAEGELPYRDFALPHLPLASFYYAGATRVLGPSLYGLRFLNVILFLAGAAALGWATLRRLGRPTAFFTTLLFLSSSLTLTWLVPVKSYAPASAALTLAVAVWLWPRRNAGPSLARAAVMGLLLGVATLSRLTLLVTVAAAAAAIWLAAPPKAGSRLAAVAALCAGFLATAPVILYFRAAAGDAFVFNVWGIHKLFLGEAGGDRLAALSGLLVIPDSMLLLVLAVIGYYAGKRKVLSFPIIVGAVIILANFVPGSAQRQYFVLAVAALAPVAGAGAAALWEKRRYTAVIVVAMAALSGAARPAAKVVFDRAHKELVGPAEVYAAADLLARGTAPDDVVFTAWPGYAALARRRVMPAWELGYFTDRIGKRLDAARRRRFHLITYDETAAALARGDVPFALNGLDTPGVLDAALSRHFEPLTSRRGVTLLRFRAPANGGDDETGPR